MSAPRRLQFTELEPPGSGEALAIAPGVRWCRIPLPIELNHINVWLLDHEAGCVVVDTGLASAVGEEAWQHIEREVFAHTPLCGIFITHIHPDHLGLAHWLQQRYRVPVWTSARTHEQLLELTRPDNSGSAHAEQFWATYGATERSLLPFLSPGRFSRMMSGVPEIARHIAGGETLHWGGLAAPWTVYATDGHAEGHLCLHSPSASVLISGDQILPTISPNIGLTWRSRDANPLGSFLASLERLATLPSDTLVLPSHGLPFRGLPARIEDLRKHHSEKLAALTDACATPKTVREILPVMFRRQLQGMHLLLALAEALAHLEYLVSIARLERDTDAAGIVRYLARRAGASAI